MKSEIREHAVLQTLKYKAVGYSPLPMRQQAQKKFSFKLHKKNHSYFNETIQNTCNFGG